MCLYFFISAFGGPNSNAKILVDLNASTQPADSILDNPSGTFTASILVQDAVNIDSYSFDISFDTSALNFIAAAEDFPTAGMENILKINGGQILSVNLGLKLGCADTIEINTTLIGSDSLQAPDGNGILCIFLPKTIILQK